MDVVWKSLIPIPFHMQYKQVCVGVKCTVSEQVYAN